MQEMEPNLQSQFAELYKIVVRLRSKDGCVWDRRQTPRSMRSPLLEEVYECIDAIDTGHDGNLKEELGDLFLLLTMIARMKEEEHAFRVSEVLQEACQKLISRHPHVFADVKKESVAEVLEQWQYIKTEVEGKPASRSVTDGISTSLPPLTRAHEIQKRAAAVSFDWKNIDSVWHKLTEEIEELKSACRDCCQERQAEQIEGELGDILFTVVNLARFLKVDPSLALHTTNQKFVRRFGQIESELQAQGKRPSDAGLEAMDAIWDGIKQQEKQEPKGASERPTEDV